jgi:hypothetical protein
LNNEAQNFFLIILLSLDKILPELVHPENIANVPGTLEAMI